jgi:Ca-activated chloride channel family protein
MFAGLSVRLALATAFVVSLAALRQSPVSPLVLVDVAVESAGGQPVVGLTKDDFAIISGGATRPIELFAAEADPVLSIVLLFDTSASVDGVTRRSEVRASVEKWFLHRLEPRDRIHIGSFARETVIGPALSGNSKDLIGAIRKALDPREADTLGPSPVWDALAAAVATLANAEGRRAVLLLTDGRATGNRLSLEEAEARAVAAGVAVSVVGEDREMTIAQDATTGVRVRPGVALARIANITGGLYLPDRDIPAAPGEILARLLADLRGRYTLGFLPPVRDGKPHELNVRVSRPGLTLRARRFYVAPPLNPEP